MTPQNEAVDTNDLVFVLHGRDAAAPTAIRAWAAQTRNCGGSVEVTNAALEHARQIEEAQRQHKTWAFLYVPAAGSDGKTAFEHLPDGPEDGSSDDKTTEPNTLQNPKNPPEDAKTEGPAEA